MKITELPARLRALRKRAGLSQIEVGNLLGCKQNTIANYESGRTEPNLEMITRYAKAFDVSCDYLLGVSINQTSKKATSLNTVCKPESELFRLLSELLLQYKA